MPSIWCIRFARPNRNFDFSHVQRTERKGVSCWMRRHSIIVPHSIEVEMLFRRLKRDKAFHALQPFRFFSQHFRKIAYVVAAIESRTMEEKIIYHLYKLAKTRTFSNIDTFLFDYYFSFETICFLWRIVLCKLSIFHCNFSRSGLKTFSHIFEGIHLSIGEFNFHGIPNWTHSIFSATTHWHIQWKFCQSVQHNKSFTFAFLSLGVKRKRNHSRQQLNNYWLMDNIFVVGVANSFPLYFFFLFAIECVGVGAASYTSRTQRQTHDNMSEIIGDMLCACMCWWWLLRVV